MDTAQPSAAVEAVVTSYNQGPLILEALDSLYRQTVRPARILLVDDGSTDPASLAILAGIEAGPAPVPVQVIRRSNGGVSAARNTGIRAARAGLVLVLDGDDRLRPAFLEKTSALLAARPAMAAASSWMYTFGVLDAVVRPSGGGLTAFLSRNSCPATHLLRRSAWEQCGGYDETMRSGFEDWEFFLRLLETRPDAQIGIVPEPLLEYRTAPASSNIQSMDKRLSLMRFIIEKHLPSYQAHLADALLGLEAASIQRLSGWEAEIRQSLQDRQPLSDASRDFLAHPSYGDGGMAAAVRLRSEIPDNA